MVNFEDGTLVKGAYVTINGVEYPVTMPEYSGKTPMSAEFLNKMQNDLLQAMFPIGSSYITQTNVNPNTILGFGIWERFKAKVSLGLDEEDSDFDTIGKTGGEKKHTLTIDEIPSHSHEILGNQISYTIQESHIRGMNNGGNATNNTKTTGGGQPHNNMQPYEVVGYMWIRRG